MAGEGERRQTRALYFPRSRGSRTSYRKVVGEDCQVVSSAISYSYLPVLVLDPTAGASPPQAHHSVVTTLKELNEYIRCAPCLFVRYVKPQERDLANKSADEEVDFKDMTMCEHCFIDSVNSLLSW